MTDAELFKELKRFDATPKLPLLEDLLSRIKNELFICEISGKITGRENWEDRLKADLLYVQEGIVAYSQKTLSADMMVKINEIYKRYKKRK